MTVEASPHGFLRFVPACLLALAALSSCGGSDEDNVQEIIARADQKEAEARAAGVQSPCADVSQCGVLAFLDPHGSCGSTWRFKPYSLVSPGAAAASAAAAEQLALAQKAVSIAANPNIACPGGVAPAPVLTCVASVCGP